MKFYRNLKISAKLIIGFLVVAMISGLIGVVTVINLNSITDNAEYLYNYATVPIKNVSSALSLFLTNRIETRNLLLSDDASEGIEAIKGNLSQIEGIMAEYEKTIATDTGRAYYEEYTTAYKAYLPHIVKVLDLIQDGKLEEASILMYGEDMMNAASDVQAGLQGLIDTRTGNAAKQYNKVVSVSATTMTVTIAFSVAGMALAIILGVVISRIISKPITRMVEVADKLALGDVDVDIEVEFKDEIGNLAQSFKAVVNAVKQQTHLAERMAEGDFSMSVDIRSDKDVLGKALNIMIDNINESMSKVVVSASQVATGAKQISDSSMLLSDGSTEQASSIEELTTSLEEISSQTENNAHNASQANELTKAVKINADKGNVQMQEMLKAMEEIKASSNNINKIIKVIDDIAFQTNILALNAAVEAARAGQYGKGFAVVAEEVRTLAAKSADAAKETTELIESSIMKVNDGTKIASETANSLDVIVSEIDKVYNLINDIAVASSEQATGIGQISQGLVQVSDVVQTNSSTAEETAAASEELTNQAELLQNMVSKFKLKKMGNNPNDMSQLSPELLEMLQLMANKGKEAPRDNVVLDQNAPHVRLSDNEFGKY